PGPDHLAAGVLRHELPAAGGGQEEVRPGSPVPLPPGDRILSGRYGGETQPEVAGGVSTTCPSSPLAVIDDAPQVQLATSPEAWRPEAPAEAPQAAAAATAAATITTRLECGRIRCRPPSSRGRVRLWNERGADEVA